jgi:hypothetical protein
MLETFRTAEAGSRARGIAWGGCHFGNPEHGKCLTVNGSAPLPISDATNMDRLGPFLTDNSPQYVRLPGNEHPSLFHTCPLNVDNKYPPTHKRNSTFVSAGCYDTTRHIFRSLTSVLTVQRLSASGDGPPVQSA